MSLSIDDFGTGFSSLSYLSRFPIDIIKIDQSFISSLSGQDAPDFSTSSVSIVRAIIALAKSPGLKTIAEGVETMEQLDFLRQNGCDAMQGYYFSRPLPVDQIDLLLQRGARLADAAHAGMPAPAPAPALAIAAGGSAAAPADWT